ncbi:hypothetical protein L596_014357 [Steinernema carpocapsae]|uniref:Uncharacterized protein n=1 Tax=Steinernema carpocapsae TaxID=34508 RepID=A0A4V6A2S2_STECR|nr:hypothetical protein L596_014357 [Steinernema carpocapsae]
MAPRECNLVNSIKVGAKTGQKRFGRRKRIPGITFSTSPHIARFLGCFQVCTRWGTRQMVFTVGVTANSAKRSFRGVNRDWREEFYRKPDQEYDSGYKAIQDSKDRQLISAT